MVAAITTDLPLRNPEPRGEAELLVLPHIPPTSQDHKLHGLVGSSQAGGRREGPNTHPDAGQYFLTTAHSQKEPKQRIRVAEHPLEVYLLFAVGTRLLLSHNAPAADTELVESEHHWSREMVGGQDGTPTPCRSSRCPGPSSGGRFKSWLHLLSVV